ncbi:MAG: BTAD domain-containing putative transcriptional regulator [Acidimicrobiia bacterium]
MTEGGGARVLVEVLGPLRAVAGGRDVTPPGPLQRRLLALLVLRRGHVVPAEVAIEALWPAGPPRDPTGALHNHVSRLRGCLPPGLVASAADGYRLDPGDVEVDGDRLAALVAAGAPTAADLAELGAVLARWHGPAYPELDHLDDARAEAARLEELRTRARELRAERRLAEGTADGVVAELTALCDAEPLRERPRALLMTALAAAGRRADALRVFDDFRRRLGDELGIEPSPALVAQHRGLLVGAPAPAVAAVAATPASPSAAPAALRRLPVPPTSLVGRDELAADVCDLAGERRAVTLVGPGGVGKTRVLLEVGRRLQEARPERPVVLCELATADARSAVNVVAAALGVDARPGVPLADQVALVLGEAPLVLLADNCEHVLDAVAGLLEHLLARCPRLTVVATSRERLRVPGEHVYPVPALPVDGGDAPAVRLFVERARAAVPGFAPDRGELVTIAEIARRLDGLPLAIELAAARLHTHDLAEVAAALDHRFALLTSGSRSSPRHASLAAAVSWSYGLLDVGLQRVFRALSAFAGPFRAADAAAVCDLDADTADAALAQLVERSLVVRTDDHRFALLETLRAFAAEQLARAGERDAVRDRHARRLVAWAADADRRLTVPGERVIDEIDAALPELHVALTWLVEQGEVERAGRLVEALRLYALLRLRPDVLAWAEKVTPLDPDDRSPVAPLLWVSAAYATWMAGDVAEHGRRVARARAAAERAGLPVPAPVATGLGNHELFEGRLDAAVRWYENSVAAAADEPGTRLLARATGVLARAYADDPTATDHAEALLAEVGDDATPLGAYAWYCAGEADLAADRARARRRYERAVELARRTGAAFVTGLAGAAAASIDARDGDPDAAARAFRGLIDHWRRAGMWATQWTMLRAIAGLLARQGKHEDAAVLVGAVRATDAGHRIFGADQAALDELDRLLRAVLGDEAYAAARARGARLDGDAAAELARRAL